MYNRTRCLEERPIKVITVWPSERHREMDGWALRVATEEIVVTDHKGRELVFAGVLDSSAGLTDQLSTAGQVESITIPWPSDTLDPNELSFADGVGEVAILWTSGTGYDSWVNRERYIDGKVGSHSWGTNRQTLQLTIQDPELIDDGQFWPPDAELNSAKHSDIASTDDRARAPNAAGLLPPLIYAPVGSAMYSPVICVKDEVDADYGVTDLIPRRLLVCQRKQVSQNQIPLGTEQFRMWHPSKDRQFMAGATSSAYQTSIPTGTDDEGGSYYYAEGEFTETFGSSSVTFTNGSAAVTATQTQGRVVEGDQVRYTGDTDDEYIPIQSRDGNAITLESNYQGAGGTNGTGVVIRQIADKGYAGFKINTLGGDLGPNGEAITAVVDVLIDLLQHARLPVPIALGDLEAMRGRLRGIRISNVRTERAPPWDWTVDRLLSWLPIRPWRSNGRIRFAWVGPVSEQEIDATIDLDTLGPAYRLQPVTWSNMNPQPAVRLHYNWKIHRQAHDTPLTLSGAKVRTGAPSDTWVPTGMAVKAFTEWDQGSQNRRITVPVLPIKTDMIEMRMSAGLMASWLLYKAGFRRPMMSLEIGRELFWCEPGAHLRVTQSGATTTAQVWRVERRTVSPSGVGSLLLEAVV